MKKLIVISDSFKGTISSREICAIARESVPRILPGCEVDAIPVADGGEGTVECFVDAIGAKPVSVLVGGPYGEAVEAIYARRDSSAIVEMASAAGGMGAGCVAFLGAELRSGIEAVLDAVDFDRRLSGAELVITGEGRVDSQSVHGNVISGIAKRTKPRNVPLVVIAGSVADDAEEAYELGVTAMFGIDRTARAFADYAGESAEYYRRTLEDVLRLIVAAKQN